jgi:hypothetical protein
MLELCEVLLQVIVERRVAEYYSYNASRVSVVKMYFK